MKAAQLIQYGGKEAIETVETAAKPIAGAGQVLVEVQAAGLNPFDWKIREGYLKDYIPLNLPVILGGDVAGTVAEIGEDVTNFEVGQAVLGQANAASGQGSFAEFTVVNIDQLILKPLSLDFVDAAALPLAATSAYQALVEHINLHPNQTVLIHGGAGGIGSFAIQIAKNIGAHVATTVGPNDIEFAKLLGADEVIDYRSQDFSTIIRDYDAVFDSIGGETNTRSYKVLKPGGILVSMVEPANEEQVKEARIGYIQQSSKATAERLSKVLELFESGAAKVYIDKTFPLDEAAAALEYLKTGQPSGKVVLKIK